MVRERQLDGARLDKLEEVNRNDAGRHHGPRKGVRRRLVCKDPHAWLMISIEMIGRAVSVHIHAADVHAA